MQIRIRHPWRVVESTPRNSVAGCGMFVACLWHDYGMARARLSTTVDRQLLDDARKARAGSTDAELIDEALTALLAGIAPPRSITPTPPRTALIRSTNQTSGAISHRSATPQPRHDRSAEARRAVVVRATEDRSTTSPGAVSRCCHPKGEAGIDRTVHDDHPWLAQRGRPRARRRPDRASKRDQPRLRRIGVDRLARRPNRCSQRLANAGDLQCPCGRDRLWLTANCQPAF